MTGRNRGGHKHLFLYRFFFNYLLIKLRKNKTAVFSLIDCTCFQSHPSPFPHYIYICNIWWFSSFPSASASSSPPRPPFLCDIGTQRHLAHYLTVTNRWILPALFHWVYSICLSLGDAGEHMLSIITVNQREMQAGTFAVAYLKTVAPTAVYAVWLPVYFCTYGHLLYTHSDEKHKLKLKGVFSYGRSGGDFHSSA